MTRPRAERMNAQSARRLAELHACCFKSGWSEREIAALLHVSTNHTTGLVQSGKITGFGIIRVAVDEAEILTICIDPAHRQSGLGAQLLATLEAEAAKAGAVRVFLEVSASNTAAQALYTRAEYSEIGRRKAYYRDGSDAFVLEKSLP